MAETVAFFSYARQDDEATWGLLSSIHKELQNLVQLKTVDQVSVFRDEERIELGDDWQEELESHLKQAHILVPILTPTYLSRPWCRKELEHFLDRGQREGRTTKILPVLLVKTQPNDARERLVNDRLAREIAKSQHADWIRHHLVRSERLPQDLINDIGALAEKMASILDKVTKPTLPPSAVGHPVSVDQGTESEITPLPQLIDREDQKEGFIGALQGADLFNGRNHALFISGPENECVMTCLDVLQQHTLKEGLDDVIVERCDVTWPARQRGDAFESAYCSTLASRLDGAVLPEPASIGKTLRALDKPLMIVSPIGRMDWQQAQVDNIETWLSIWYQIFLAEPDLRATPIIYTRLPGEKPGWQFSSDAVPTCALSDGRLSPLQIIKELRKLNGYKNPRKERSGLFGFFANNKKPDLAAFKTLPPLAPIDDTHVSPWLDHLDYNNRDSHRVELINLFTGEAGEKGLDMVTWVKQASPILGHEDPIIVG